jgi:hypothetical protein
VDLLAQGEGSAEELAEAAGMKASNTSPAPSTSLVIG